MTCSTGFVCSTRRKLTIKFIIGILTLLFRFHSLHSMYINVGIVNIEPFFKVTKPVAEQSFSESQLLFRDEVNTTFNVSITVFDLHGKAGILHELDQIFSNASLSVIVAYVPDKYVQILNIFAKDSSKPLVLANNYLPHQDSGYVLSMFNGFRITSEAIQQYLEHFQWQNVAIIASDEVFWRQMVPILENQLMKQNFNVKRSRIVTNMTDSSVVRSIIREITASEKAILLLMEPEIAVELLYTVDRLGIEKNNFVYILIARTPFFNTSIIDDAVQNMGAQTYESILVLHPIFNVTNIFNNVTFELIPHDDVKKSLRDAATCILQGAYNKNSTVNNTLYLRKQESIVDILETKFVRGGEPFEYDANRERYFSFALLDIEEQLWKLTISKLMYKLNGKWNIRRISDIDWTNDKVILPDPCFKNTNCTPEEVTQWGVKHVYVQLYKHMHCRQGDGLNTASDSSIDQLPESRNASKYRKGHSYETNNKNKISTWGVAVAVPIILLVVIVVGVLIFMFVWKKQRKINMTRGPNKILLEVLDLTYLHKKEAKSAKINGPFLDKPDLVKASEKSNRSLASLHEFSEFSEIARYKGDIVFVKELKVKGFEMKGKLLSYLRTLRDIRHENVNPLYGLLIDPLRPALVSEYCSRGSLWDVLKNENIKLDWDFKVSLLSDAVRGLRFIQGSPIRSHGNLKSRNCVIDSRWVLKLSDFGMPGFKECAKMTANYDPDQLLWTAPEHLRDPFPGTKGSEKGDIYSLAIIMQEVILRVQPYGMLEYKSKELIQRLRNPPPLIRPKVSPQAAQPQYIVLMKQCWSESPDLRPTIEDIYQQFKSIAGGKKTNIVDSMFRMLEKYSNDLEDLVKERTVQLEEEKKKTDLLLFRMLPPSVAEKLKLGRPIEAEEFEEVTIYFSDIVGFTTISARSTPMQVVDLLNDLYTMFDATIDNYDVYKVETIGDAYMVVSGLPMANGNRHAGEIGTMALDLLSQCGTFTIRHMPEVPLRLRIGLHSGSCVAGVVGLTMPRYCLFGDTVNTASRMESTGAAFRIHISEMTKDVLDSLGGYRIEYRGEVELKGKGLAKTYWLTGKDGFTKPLPEPPPLHDLESILSQNASSTTDLKEKSDSSENVDSRATSPSKDQKAASRGPRGTASKDRASKTKGGVHKGKTHTNDNFSNINDVSKIKHEENSELSHSPDITQVDSAANHCDTVSLLRKDFSLDNKKGNNYRMSKYSNASMDSVSTETSVISTSELHMTVLSKHDENGSIKGSPGKLSPVAEV